MAELPTGTVTFLFTDVEGSTRLLHELGDGYAHMLGEHRRILREAFGRHGGVEVDTQGDAFFVAFARASGALDAAAEARDALSAGPVRVRMGLHTGEPLVTDEGYVGIDVHRAARIAAAGHGGQILVSQSTRDLAGAAGLRDLGEHRLKDLTAAERIYQLGDGDFPPLKSLNQSNLPLQPTPLVGRRRELEAILDLLHRHRLVTLSGAGGSGKTRLALQAAAEALDDYPDGVWFVSFAALRDHRLIESTIAQVLGAREDLPKFLCGKKLLLVLDNLEQLLPDGAPIVASVDATVLATSRERLNVAAEHEYGLPTLPIEDAVTLFAQRARQLDPAFEPDEHVTTIAQRLDGLPLAVELAAALVKVLTPQHIRQRLDRGFELLVSGARDAPARQQTLRATIDWSFDLLTPQGQALFSDVSVFAGSFELEAAEVVANADVATLGALVDKSLLRRTGEGRFFMLETIREYAAERLRATGRADALRRRHAEWIRAMALEAREELRGERQVESLDRLSAEHANVRDALTFALASQDSQLAIAIAGSLGRFWIFRGHDREGRRWLDAALALPATTKDELRGRALYWDSVCADGLGDEAAAMSLAEEALALAHELNNRELIGAASLEVARRLIDRNDVANADAVLEEASTAAKEDGDELSLATLSIVRGQLLLAGGDAVSAVSELEDSVAFFCRRGDQHLLAHGLAQLGLAQAAAGRLAESRASLREGLTLNAELGFPYGVAICLEGAALLAVGSDDGLGAAALLSRADGLFESVGSWPTNVEAVLYRQTWERVRKRVDEATRRANAVGFPEGDLDEAVAYTRRYLH